MANKDVVAETEVREKMKKLADAMEQAAFFARNPDFAQASYWIRFGMLMRVVNDTYVEMNKSLWNLPNG